MSYWLRRVGANHYAPRMLPNEKMSPVAHAFRSHLMDAYGFLDFDEHFPCARAGLDRADYFLRDPRILVEQKDVHTQDCDAIEDLIERTLSEANGQIRDAKEITGWTDAEGVLLLINQIGGNLSFSESLKTIRRRLSQIRPNGEVRFSNIKAVLYVHHAQGYAVDNQGRDGVCCVGAWGSTEFNKIVRTVGRGWRDNQRGPITYFTV